MRSDQFWNICGGSLFPEEYRGDLDAAWHELQRIRPDHSTAEPQIKAEYLRCFAIYSIITGDLAEAYRTLKNLHALLDTLPAEWGLRYTIYMLLADYTRQYPPTLRFYHERGKPVSIAMLSDISGPKEMSDRFMERVRTYFETGSVRNKALCQILREVMWFPMLARKLNAELDPLFPGGLFHNTGADPDDIIAQHAAGLVECRESAEKAGEMWIAAYLSRLLVEFRIASQSSDWMTALNDLYDIYHRQEDFAGTANCQMMKGDGLLGPSFTSPLTLNLVLVDASSAIGEDNLWDPVELELKDQYSSQVKECYEAALELFGRANCRRGQAAVLLRQACCLHIAARRLKPTDSSLSTLIHDARAKLEQSKQLFGKDEVNCQIVTAHQVLLDITIGDNRKVKRTASGIGTWAAQAKNQSVGHCLGLLIFRFARQEWYTFARMDNALVAWECAYEIFESIDDVLPMFQSVVSRAWVQGEMFNLAALKILVDKAVEMVDIVRQYYDILAESAPDTDLGEADRVVIQANKFNTLSSFGSNVSTMYMRLGDPQLAHAWQSKFAGIMEDDESFREMREQMEKGLDFQSVSPALSCSKAGLKGLWQRRVVEDAMAARFRDAMFQFQEWLDKGDIVRAEAVYRRFMDETKNMESSYARDCYRLLFCRSVGDQTSARMILDSMDDNALFQDNLKDYQQGIGVKSTFSDVADNALMFCLLSQDEERAYRVVQIIQQISPTFYDTMDDNVIDRSFRLSYYGATMLYNGHSQVALLRLLEARQLIELRRQQTTDVDARVGTFMSGWMVEVYLNLARACLKCADARVSLEMLQMLDHGHPDDLLWEEHALLFLEESRARAVLEALKTQIPHDQDEHNPSAALSELIQKRRLLRTLLGLRQRTPEQEEEIGELRSQISHVEADQVSATASPFVDMANSIVTPRLLYQNIDADAVVIEATFGYQGFIAIAVTSDGIQNIYQDRTRSVDIRKPVMQMMKVLTEMTGYLGDEEEERKELFSEYAQQISRLLVEPFKKTIRQKKHVIISTSDPLTAFPFSALVLEGQPLMARFAVSQIPGLTVLYHVSQRESQSAAPTVSVFARSPSADAPCTMRDKQEANLHLAGIEAVNIARTFSTWPVDAKNVTRAEFRKYVEGSSSILHIGAHGDVDNHNPLLSSISIGEDFRVLDMSTIKTNVNLLVFAACLSGLGRATTGSDILGFSHVILSTGCQAYIGTLRKVSDFASMLLMTLFYRTLKEAPSMPLACILRQVQLEIGQFDSERAADYLDQLMQTSPSGDGDSRGLRDFVPDAEYMIWTTKMILDQLDWSSPFFWAPFVLMGYGSLRFATQ
jgi:CHAT domain-containing protein